MATRSEQSGFGARSRIVLVTGASGYVGGRLLPPLLGRGLRVRCLARRPESVPGHVTDSAEVVAGDVLDRDSLERALAGVDTAYYLVHSMAAGADFEARDERGARNFAAAARSQGVRRIIYLGGLGEEGGPGSAHMRSRQAVGTILRESGVPTMEFRASIVIGSGSLSFEMIRALVERLPAMITPRWVGVVAQPIAIDDLVAYLIAALDHPGRESQVLEIGGADRVSYGNLMREYGRQRGLRRLMLPVPLLTPRLSSLWLRLFTPLYARVGRALIDSIRTPSVVRDESALRLFPIRPVGMREAIAAALRDEDRKFAASRWVGLSTRADAAGGRTRGRFGNRIVETRSRAVAVPPERAFEPIARIGGDRGWYAHDWMWRLRGGIDRLLGGTGTRRGLARTGGLHAGMALDFWRVEAYEPGRRLRLVAEMKLPGRAWLDFEVEPEGAGSIIHQTAVFDPLGLAGLSYWHLLRPFHRLIFDDMLAGIARAAEKDP